MSCAPIFIIKMDQILETPSRRETHKREHDFEGDVQPKKSSEVNNDSVYLTEYMNKHAMPQTLNEFTEEHSEEHRFQVYETLSKNNIKFQYPHTESNLEHMLGRIFSDVLMAAYIPTLKRDGISYKLYSPRFINNLPFYSMDDELPAFKTFKTILNEWTYKFELDITTCSTTIIRSGLLIGFQFHEDLTTGEEAGHEIFLLAERNKDSTVIYIVDNLNDRYYQTNCSQFNIHDFIKSTLRDYRYTAVLSLVNKLPMQPETLYTCASCARRAAIYAAIIKDFAKMSTWNEKYESELFQYHYNHYLSQMNKMFKWFDRTKEFWHPPYWTFWASDNFFAYNKDTYHRHDLIVELTRDIAYVEVLKEGKFVKLWFNSEGSPAFVESKESGGCRTSGIFKF